MQKRENILILNGINQDLKCCTSFETLLDNKMKRARQEAIKYLKSSKEIVSV